MLKYGVFFKSYKGQIYDMWVHISEGRLERDDPSHPDLISLLRTMRNMNPHGNYEIMQILD